MVSINKIMFSCEKCQHNAICSKKQDVIDYIDDIISNGYLRLKVEIYCLEYKQKSD